MNENDDLVNGRWSNKFYVAIDYNLCSFIVYYKNALTAWGGAMVIGGVNPSDFSVSRQVKCTL